MNWHQDFNHKKSEKLDNLFYWYNLNQQQVPTYLPTYRQDFTKNAVVCGGYNMSFQNPAIYYNLNQNECKLTRNKARSNRILDTFYEVFDQAVCDNVPIGEPRGRLYRSIAAMNSSRRFAYEQEGIVDVAPCRKNIFIGKIRKSGWKKNKSDEVNP